LWLPVPAQAKARWHGRQGASEQALHRAKCAVVRQREMMALTGKAAASDKDAKEAREEVEAMKKRQKQSWNRQADPGLGRVKRQG